MSSAARGLIYKHFKVALAQWPQDPLRPASQLQDVLSKRLEGETTGRKPFDEKHELKQLNALYSLLDDRYKTKYRIAGSLLEPQSNPTYYSDLIRELEEAPKRTWFERMSKRFGGMLRMS